MAMVTTWTWTMDMDYEIAWRYVAVGDGHERIDKVHPEQIVHLGTHADFAYEATHLRRGRGGMDKWA